MKKSEMIRLLAEKTGLTGVVVEKVLDRLPEVVADDIKATGKSSVPGVCRLAVEQRRERTYRNPRTGDPVVAPARSKIKATPAGTLSLTVLGESDE